MKHEDLSIIQYLLYCIPEHDSCQGLSWKRQNFCALKLLCSGHYKRDTVCIAFIVMFPQNNKIMRTFGCLGQLCHCIINL